jgi:hypothetical protein
MKKSVWLAGIVAAGMLPGIASGASVTVNFEFSVYAISQELVSGFSLGDKAIGSFTYETTTPGGDYDPMASGNPLPNFRYYQGALTSFSFTLAGKTFSEGADLTARIMAVADDETQYDFADYINLIDFAPNASDLVGGLAASTVSFLFIDLAMEALSSADLPEPFPGIGLFEEGGDSADLDIFYGPFSDDVRVSLRLTKLWTGEQNGPTDPTEPTDPTNPTNVPEPGTLVLVGAALFGLGLWRRRKP